MAAKVAARTRAVAYCRVSTKDQADSGLSLDAQQVKLRQYADLYDLDLVAVVEDRGESAKTLDRPGLQRALAMLRSGDADAIVVMKLDRLTRSVADLGELLKCYFAEGRRWSLMSVSEQVDTRTSGGRLVLNVLTSVAQWEREAIAERTKAAMAQLARDGRARGRFVPFGFRLAGMPNVLEVPKRTDPDAPAPLLVEHPEEQTIVLEIAQLERDGCGARQIARRLGINPRTGRPWSIGAVRSVLGSRARREEALAA